MTHALFLGPFYLIGAGVLGFGLWSAHRSLQAADWPVVEGAMTDVSLATDRGDGDGAPTHQVKVAYTYEVDGRKYEGDRLAYGYASSNFGQHELIHEKLKAAQAVEVRYNPDNPAESVLSYGLHQSIKFLLAFGAMWLVFIVGFHVLFWVTSRADSVLLDNLTTR